MTSNAPNPSSIFATRQQVTAALERAAQRARIIAEQTGTKLIVVTQPNKPAAPAPKPQ
jgi:capsule polysaccharide export protein KpsE/RkpR